MQTQSFVAEVVKSTPHSCLAPLEGIRANKIKHAKEGGKGSFFNYWEKKNLP